MANGPGDSEKLRTSMTGGKSRRLSAVFGILQPKPVLRFMPTYRLDPKTPLNKEFCEKVIKNVMDKALEDFVYNPKPALNLSAQISEEIKNRIKTRAYDSHVQSTNTATATQHIQCINFSHKLDMQKAKVNLLAFKSVALDKKMKEDQNKQKILVRLTAQNANKNQAMDSVKKALQELDKFYALYDNNNNNPQCLQLAKEELWQKMRAIFVDLPNFLFFNAIMRLMDEFMKQEIAMSIMKIARHHMTMSTEVDGRM